MSETTGYVDIVTVSTPHNGTVLRHAPAFSGLKIGDKVMIEMGDNVSDVQGYVADIATFNLCGEEYRTLRTFVGIKGNGRDNDMDYRVTTKVLLSPLWPNDEEDE